MSSRSRYVAAALALSHIHIRTSSAALLGGKINNHAVATVIAAATTTDEGLLACATADAITNSCFLAGSLDLTVPVETMEQCLCCYSSIELDDIYYSCASYILYNQPIATEAFSMATSLYDICDLSGSCPVIDVGGGGNGPPNPTALDPITPTSPVAAPQPTAPPPAEITAPAICTSLASVWQSCSSGIPGFDMAPVSELVECFCYDKRGAYNTDVQDYADGCEPWAKTADPTDYDLITVLQTFCDVYAATPPTAGPGPRPTTTRPFFTTKSRGGGSSGGSTNDGGFGFGQNNSGGSSGSGSTASTPTSSVDSSDSTSASAVIVTVTQTAARENAAVRGIEGSLFRWGVISMVVGVLFLGI